MAKLDLTKMKLTCLRCTVKDKEGNTIPFTWYPRKDDVRVCPNCHSYLWDVPRKEEDNE